MNFVANLVQKVRNWSIETGISVVVQAPIDHAWTLMLFECVKAGYWICETDQASKQFKYFVPNDALSANKMSLKDRVMATGQQVIVCVAALSPQACLVSVTANNYEGEHHDTGIEQLTKPRQRQLIGWLISKLANKFTITNRSAAPGTPLNIEDVTPPPALPTTAARAPASSPQQSGSKTSFDFLGK
jgi:hypothetical protein